MRNKIIYNLYVTLILIVVGCSSNKPSYVQKIEVPIASNGMPFDLFAYKQDTSITIITSHGTAIKIDPNTFAHANGTPVSNQIIIKLREMHTAADIFKSGIPMSIDVARKNFLQSGGMLEIRAFDNAEELVIANGKSIGVELANFSPATGFSLYQLQNNQNWQVSDTFIVKQNQRKANALNKIAEFLKKPFLKKTPIAHDEFELVADLKESPHLRSFQNQKWKIVDGTDPEIVDRFMRLNWDDVVVSKVNNKKNNYQLEFTRSITVLGIGEEKRSFTLIASPVLTSDTSFTKQLLDYEKTIASMKDEKIRLQAEADMVSSFRIRQMGVWNIDKIMKNEDLAIVSINFDFEKKIDLLVNQVKLFVLFEEDNSVIYYLPQDWNKVRLSKTKRTSLVAVLPDNKVAVVDAKEVSAKLKNGNAKLFFNTVERSASSYK
jgi:hypothetical protein